jgi:hypothetical protein
LTSIACDNGSIIANTNFNSRIGAGENLTQSRNYLRF